MNSKSLEEKDLLHEYREMFNAALEEFIDDNKRYEKSRIFIYYLFI